MANKKNWVSVKNFNIKHENNRFKVYIEQDNQILCVDLHDNFLAAIKNNVKTKKSS